MLGIFRKRSSVHASSDTCLTLVSSSERDNEESFGYEGIFESLWGQIGILPQDWAGCHINQNDVQSIEIRAVVMKSGDVDECFLGFWYGVELYQNGQFIGKATVHQHGDGCFVSKMANDRRLGIWMLTKMMAEYIKGELERSCAYYGIKLNTLVTEYIGISSKLLEEMPHARHSI
jgi:hypothetical protein